MKLVSTQVRLIQDINLQGLHYQDVRGKEEYKALEIAENPDSSSVPLEFSNLTSYKANCHCGTVTYTVHTPPLTDLKVLDCNCSICRINGYHFIYPQRWEVIFHSGYDHLNIYEFYTKTASHKFCRTCGSSIMMDCKGLGPAILGVDPLAMNVISSYFWSLARVLTIVNRFVCFRMSI
jgi:hypothetical protein